MKMLVLLEGVLEVVPLLLLCLYICLCYLYIFLSVLAIGGLWLVLKEKIRSLGRTLSDGPLGQGFRMIQVPVVNFSFKASCISIICTIFENDLKSQATFVLIGACITFNVAHKCYEGRSENERVVSAIFYAVTNVVFPTRCPMITRCKSLPQVSSVNMNWVLLYTVTILYLMYQEGVPPLNLGFWTFHQSDYINIIHKCFVLLVLGPLSVYVMFKFEDGTPDEVNFDALDEFDKFRYILMIKGR